MTEEKDLEDGQKKEAEIEQQKESLKLLVQKNVEKEQFEKLLENICPYIFLLSEFLPI